MGCVYVGFIELLKWEDCPELTLYTQLRTGLTKACVRDNNASRILMTQESGG